MEKIRTQFDDVCPIPRVAVRVWLADGTRTIGMWTRSRWWSSKGEIHPVRWELEVREKRLKNFERSFGNQNAKVGRVTLYNRERIRSSL
jgi:hypothetical protein